MEALDALLKEVEALDREATPGPWVANIAESEVSSAGWNEAAEAEGLPKMPRFRTEVELFCETASGRGNVFPSPFMGLPYAGNARATAHYRTAAPRLAAIVRVLLGNATSLVDLVAPRHARRPNGEFQINCGSCGARVDYADEDARDVASARMVHDDVCPYFKTVTALARIEALAKGEA